MDGLVQEYMEKNLELKREDISRDMASHFMHPSPTKKAKYE